MTTSTASIARRWEDVALGAYATPPEAFEARWRGKPTLGFYWNFYAAISRWRRALEAGRAVEEVWIGFARDTLRSLERVGVQFDLAGFGPDALLRGPFVAAGNHMSLIDGLLAAAIWAPQRPISGVISARMVGTPLVGKLLGTSGGVTVQSRSARRDLEKVYREAVPRIRAGESFAVFPEGGRNREFDPGAFNSMGVKMAKRAGVPLVPFALRTDAWGIGLRQLYLAPVRLDRPVRLRVGKPIAIEARDQPQRAEQIRFIAQHVASWGVRVRSDTRRPWWLNLDV